MKRKIGLISGLVVLMVFLSGCDPKYPPGNLKTEPIHSIEVGESFEIKLIYPTGGLFVIGWKNQRIEVTSNPEIISVSGLTFTGLKSGSATIKITATTVLDDYSYQNGEKEIDYSVSAKIIVK